MCWILLECSLRLAAEQRIGEIPYPTAVDENARC